MSPREVADSLRQMNETTGIGRSDTALSLAGFVEEFIAALDDRDFWRKQGRDIGTKRINQARSALRAAVMPLSESRIRSKATSMEEVRR